jgi:hypothetical protein
VHRLERLALANGYGPGTLKVGNYFSNLNRRYIYKLNPPFIDSMANPYYKKMVGVNSTNPMGTSGFNRGSRQTLQNSSRIVTNMSPQGNISDRLGASGNPEDDEDFIPLTQGTDTSLGYEAAMKVRQKRPGKRDREPAEA